MEKISLKKGLYFVKYSISKLRDFSGIFLNFLGTFQIFEHIYENATLIFKVKIYKNTLQFLKSEIYKNATPIFKVKNYRNAPPIYRNFRSQYFTEMPLCTISIKDYDFSKLKSWYLMI